MNARKRDGRAFMLSALLGIAGAAFLTGCGGGDEEEKKDPPLPVGDQQPSHPPMPLAPKSK